MTPVSGPVGSVPGQREMAWKPGRYWVVLAPDGSTWCETSTESEARERVRPGDRLMREWVTEPHADHAPRSLDPWRRHQ